MQANYAAMAAGTIENFLPLHSTDYIEFYSGNGKQATPAEIIAFLVPFKSDIEARLRMSYDGFILLKSEGLPVDAITSQATNYLT